MQTSTHNNNVYANIRTIKGRDEFWVKLVDKIVQTVPIPLYLRFELFEYNEGLYDLEIFSHVIYKFKVEINEKGIILSTNDVDSTGTNTWNFEYIAGEFFYASISFNVSKF